MVSTWWRQRTDRKLSALAPLRRRADHKKTLVRPRLEHGPGHYLGDGNELEGKPVAASVRLEREAAGATGGTARRDAVRVIRTADPGGISRKLVE